VSSFSSSREQILASLKHYSKVMRDKNEALLELQKTSQDMKSTLKTSDLPGISEIINKREKQCIKAAKAFEAQKLDLSMLIEFARRASDDTNDELYVMASNLAEMQTYSNSMAESILSYQQECEHILRRRLESTGEAINNSVKRRRLDSAYGPAHTGTNPRYIDKQR
jgi:hypothetical protein